MKNKTFIKKLSVIFLLIVIVVSFCSCGKKKEKKPIITKEYEILNVSTYIKTETNMFGGTENTYACYTFQYIDDEEIKTVSDFRNMHCGIQRVILGESNKFIKEKQGFDCIYYLQLTEETIRKMDLE